MSRGIIRGGRGRKYCARLGSGEKGTGGHRKGAIREKKSFQGAGREGGGLARARPKGGGTERTRGQIDGEKIEP